MRYLSVCSGIEAATVAWHPLGWQPVAFSEIEPFPSAVLAHHYPAVPNVGDMTTLPDRIRSGEVAAPDLFCGGTPCQAFSVAGLRKSLDDARGNLSLTFCEIANAIDDVRRARGEPPAIIFWENVPGVLSTKDNAFGCFLGALAGSDTAIVPNGRWTDAGVVAGPKRTVAWRTLDAQYFGVAQRRKRVFVVASARDGFDPAAVLFEWQGVRRDTAPSREKGQGAAASAVPSIAGSLDTQCGGGKLTHQSVKNGHLIGTITARMFCSLGALDVEEGALLPVAGALCKDTYSGGMGGKVDMAMQGYALPIVFHPTQNPISSENVCHSISSGNGQGCATAAVLAPTLTASNDPSRSPQSSEITAQVAAVVQATAAVALQDVRAMNKAQNGRGWNADGTAYTVDTHATQGVATAMQVRRLTPEECEALQGFPRSYTAIPWRGKPASECPDGPRYKALGNSWAVPVVRWIGKRIAEAEA